MNGAAAWILAILILANPVAALSTLSFASLQQEMRVSVSSDGRAPHAPIRIITDAGYLVPDSVSGNGVVRGRGTADDPFIIEGWEISFTWTTPAILIRETHLHVILRDLLLKPETAPEPSDFGIGPALAIQGATNVTLESIRIKDDWDGFPYFTNSEVRVREVVLENSTLSARDSRLWIEDVEAHGTTRQRTALMCFGCSIEAKRVHVFGYGPVLRDSQVGLIGPGALSLVDTIAHLEGIRAAGMGNVSAVGLHNSSVIWKGGFLEGTATAISIGGGSNVVLSDIEHRPRPGGAQTGSFSQSDVMIRNLSIFGPGGIIVSGGHVQIEKSLFDGPGNGVIISRLENSHRKSIPTVVIHNSSFININEIGVRNDVPEAQVDARWNWWGSPEGPVFGSSIRDRNVDVVGNVRVEPWLRDGPLSRENRDLPTPSTWLVIVALALVGLLGSLVLPLKKRP